MTIPFKIVARDNVPFVVGIPEAADAFARYYQMALDAQTQLAAVDVRGGLYGLLDSVSRRAFAIAATEFAFNEGAYRAGYAATSDILAIPPFDYTRTAIASAPTATGSTQFFAENIPRITNRGLLVEGSVQNKFLQSEAFDNAAWTKSLVSVTPNVAPGPRGDGTMDKIVATGTGVHSIKQAVTSVSTASFYAKAGELGWCVIEFATGSAFPFAYFDLINGAIGNVSVGVTARIERAARGAWRISATLATGNATVSVYAATSNGGASFIADAGIYLNAGFYLDMAQAEASARPSSYIPTSAVAVTRSGDRPSLDFAPSGDFTIYAEAEMPAPRSTADAIIAITSATETHRVVVYRDASNNYVLQVTTPEAQQVFPGPFYADSRIVRVAISRAGNRISACFDGGAILSTVTLFPENLSKVWIGLAGSTLGSELNGFVRAAWAYPRAMTDAELQAITIAGNRATPASTTETLIEEALLTHSNDTIAHEVESVKRTAELADSKAGLWAIVASDTFTGVSGALTTTEVGGLAWVSPDGNAIHRIGGVAKSPVDNLRGTLVTTTYSDGQVEGDLVPGTGEASLYFRWKQNGDYLMLQRGSTGAIGLKKFIGGTATDIAPVRYLPVEAGERYKVRFVGSRIWVFRIVGGVETIMFDVIETQWQTEKMFGLRVNGTGSVDNFRLLGRGEI